MDLIQDTTAFGHQLRWCRDDAIGVDDQELRSSFILSPEALQSDWPVVDISQLNEESLAPILALQPELVLLGSGIRQRFPSQAVLAALLGRGIGTEVMDNRAAARTYSLLAGEGRRVVAAFILPGDAGGASR